MKDFRAINRLDDARQRFDGMTAQMTDYFDYAADTSLTRAARSRLRIAGLHVYREARELLAATPELQQFFVKIGESAVGGTEEQAEKARRHFAALTLAAELKVVPLSILSPLEPDMGQEMYGPYIPAFTALFGDMLMAGNPERRNPHSTDPAFVSPADIEKAVERLSELPEINRHTRLTRAERTIVNRSAEGKAVTLTELRGSKSVENAIAKFEGMPSRWFKDARQSIIEKLELGGLSTEWIRVEHTNTRGTQYRHVKTGAAVGRRSN